MGRALRVLYSTHASNLTGASQSLLDLLAGFDRSRVEPTVLLRERGPLEGRLAEMGVPCAVVPHVSDVRPTSPLKSFAKRTVGPILQLGVDRFVREGGFDLVHCNSLLCLAGARAARRVGVPYVCHVREFVREDHGLEFLDETSVRDLLSHASGVVFISRAVGLRFGPWAPEARSVVAFDSVDAERYRADHAPLLAEEPVRLLLAGRIAPGKGQMDAIRSVELLTRRGVDVRLTLVGGPDGTSYRDDCMSYVSSHGLGGSVTLSGFRDDLGSLHAESDIALMCSTSEAMGRVTVESMMAGCLVVGADAGATPELVRDGETGLLYRAGDPSSLADRVEWAASNPERAREIAARGQRWAVTDPAFDRAAYADKMTNLYEEIARE